MFVIHRGRLYKSSAKKCKMQLNTIIPYFCATKQPVHSSLESQDKIECLSIKI